MTRSGWVNALSAMMFHHLANDGFPGWDKQNDEPHFVLFEFVSGQNKSSLAVASAWDDMAKGQFYYRDFTDSGLPIVREGDRYQSRFSFQFSDEVDRFSQWIGEQWDMQPIEAVDVAAAKETP